MMTRKDMLKVVLTPGSVTIEENELQWYKERAAALSYLVGCFHELVEMNELDDLLWLLEQWGIAQRWG